MYLSLSLALHKSNIYVYSLAILRHLQAVAFQSLFSGAGGGEIVGPIGAPPRSTLGRERVTHVRRTSTSCCKYYISRLGIT